MAPAPDHLWYFRSLQGAIQAHREATAPDPRKRLERARTLLHDRFADPLDLDAIASAAHWSRFHFAREFRREFGVTPHQYLTERRLERAKDLLVRTDRSVTEVCLEVGFSSLGSFSTLFSRHVGHTPSRYRRTLVDCLGIPAALPPIPACFLTKFAGLTYPTPCSPPGLPRERGKERKIREAPAPGRS